MSDARLDALLAQAFHTGKAVDANQEIGQVRAQRSGDGARQVLSYEIIVPPEEPVKHLVETVLPRLVYFLDCRGARLPKTDDVFASIFVGDALHFLDTEPLFEALSQWSGLSFDAMLERWGSQSV